MEQSLKYQEMMKRSKQLEERLAERAREWASDKSYQVQISVMFLTQAGVLPEFLAKGSNWIEEGV